MNWPDQEKGLPTVTLHPGELFVAREPTVIHTILGSCVSVCLFCPTTRTGAMCHGIMPSHSGPHHQGSFRFVESSVNYMIEALLTGTAGCSSVSLVAKIFGGANVLPTPAGKDRPASSIGSQNIEAARQALAKNNIRLATEKVGGGHGCKIFFYAHTGDVFYKKLSR
jgi:chemotaxis protein CheD